MHGNLSARQRIAVIGTGISGMSAAWLLSQRHEVVVYECEGRTGGHSNTILVPSANDPIAVDTGFIVYNELTYPNLTALFSYLQVPTQLSNMSFAVSLRDGDIEYSGGNLFGLFADKRNLFRSHFWSMLIDLQRFYREAPGDLAMLDELHTTLGDYLDSKSYGSAFRNHHLLPMAASIWSTPANAILKYPAASFIRFQNSHGLLKLRNRPPWRTVLGGSRVYVERLTRSFADRIKTSTGVESIRRTSENIEIRDCSGRVQAFGQVVIGTHADQALRLLIHPTIEERRLLGAFRYTSNAAILHSDSTFMPKRRAVWSSWNHIGRRDDNGECPTVTYWMNSLQNIPHASQLFLTLNPQRTPCNVWHSEVYAHPMFDSAAIRAQKELWSLQGRQNTWFCGAYFGAGFHEDGLQAGLAVAEAIGGVRRPWNVPDESGRIVLDRRPSTGRVREYQA
jgi:uncharacterized protein